MSENKTGKPASRAGRYLKYAIGEILLVMIGILLALQVNTWNEDRKNKKIEQILLRSIVANLKQDDSLLNRAISRYEIGLNSIERIFYGDQIPDDSLAYFYSRATGHSPFIPITTAFERSLSSGKFDLIENDSLANSIQFHYAFTYKSANISIDYLNKVNDKVRAMTQEFQAMDISPTERKDVYDKDYVLPFNLENLKKRNSTARFKGLLKAQHINSSQVLVFYTRMKSENLALQSSIFAYLKKR